MVATKVLKAVAAIKKPFMSFAEQFGKLAASRAELAPKFMKAYGLFQADEEGGNFVEFVRLIDPTVPADRDAYRVHRSYAAADYLRRLRNRRDVGAKRAKPIRSKVAETGRLLATILAFAAEPEKVWQGIAQEFTLTPRQLTKLRSVTAASTPIIRIPNVRPVRVQIVHVEPEVQQAAAAAARPARRNAA